jgi:hypothetical protein
LVDIQSWSQGIYLAVIQDKLSGNKKAIQFIKE